MRLAIVVFFSCFALPAVAGLTAVTVPPTADAFTSTANPTGNYGGGGVIAVAATGLPKGGFSGVMKFDFTSARSTLDAAYPGGWTVASVVMTMTMATGVNTVFNSGTAAGRFNATWFADDSWIEGTGNPNGPGSTGITGSALTTLLGGTTEPLGSYSYDGTTAVSRDIAFALTPGFLADVTSGGIGSIAITPADSVLNMFFNSRSFGTTSAQPFITIKAGASRVIAVSIPQGGGTVTGAGTYADGTDVRLAATPDATHVFVNWTEAGTVVSATASYTFTAGANRTLVANFAPAFSFATSALPAAGGTTVGDGSYATGSGVTLVATPNAGYSFGGWTENGALVSNTASYVFTATASRTLVAHFALIIPQLSTVIAAPGSYTVSWPNALPNWSLQESPDLSHGSWLDSSRTVTLVGDRNQVLVTGAGNRRFFRLVHVP